MSSHARTARVALLRRTIGWAARAIGVGLAVLLLVGGYFWFSTDLPAPEHLRARAALGSTRILDRRGQLLYALPDPLSGRQRPIALPDIPIALRQATIAVEDAGFYQNSGVELSGILRAAWIDLRSGALVAGGSTITQQLARGFLLDPALAQQRTLDRKLREAVLALKLTAAYSKDEILALYLNQTYYGGMSYGVEAAARHYFGKPARDLDLAECALLAGLPQAPSRYDPFVDRAVAQARQADVLDAMARAGTISAAQAAAAKSEPLQFAAADQRMRAPHFVQYVLGLLDTQLGPEMVARGGLTVTTTLDVDLQAAAQELLRKQIARLATPRDGGPDHRVRNGAVVVLDPASGAILTMVGSPNFDDAASQGQVNAALARRQPGSAIKPLTYAAALERGWTPASTILDIPTTFQTREGRPYAPQNYDRAYHGPLALREALATSSNVAAVQLLDRIGIPALLDMAKRLGITTLGDAGSSGRYGLSLTLGGGEVTPLELTAAFGAFANGGRRVMPFAIIDIAASQGDKVTRWQGDKVKAQDVTLSPPHLVTPSQVLSPQVAYLITDILADRYARMRAFGSQSALDIDRPAAAKTGTTSDWRDNWTVGYTPDRVVGVWVGNADGQPMEAISGVTGAGPLWHAVMLAAHRGLPARQFARPDGIVETTICAEGGLLPTPSCPATRRELFLAGSEPHQLDASHVAVAIDAQLDCRAPAGYPAERVTTRIFRILPPEAESWVVAAGLARVPRQVCPVLADEGRRTIDDGRQTTDDTLPVAEINLSPCHLVTLSSCQPAAPALLTPAPGAVFALSPGVPRERQQIELQARAGADVAKLTLLVDGLPLAVFDGPPYRAFWPLAPGPHRARVETTDVQGQVWRSATVEFVVEGP
jgi:1A family penicillin-binding protein